MKTRTNNRIRELLITSVEKFLRQGLSPKMISRTIASALFVGTIPVPGVSTLLCALLAAAFKMNLALIQVVNYLVFPLQLLLFLPFINIATRLSGKGVFLEIPHLMEQMTLGNWQNISAELFWLISSTILVWIVIMFPVSALCYFGLNPVVAAIRKNKADNS
ncbi:MAG: DUF2062 domain-containing protein [Lentimicrobium sp.]|nr:DUF2062 domain-containing protein [Lentimicrobium sp.]